MENRKNALTANEVLAMTDEERSKLWSACWHDSRYDAPRCGCRGIQNFKIEQTEYSGDRFIVSWDDRDGSPRILISSCDEKIHQTGDGEWDYGLYKTN
ncbi:MAG: hypothetical protein SLAVMIC_00096 [uncultured marine phage]|uniref:Uncharacterized protein n=1 Tax=uncultured marine phage TaxID=707152 RepID=A0A8D9CEL3_9VIRU|nr:MAG: hypothetical protein SLAVMIC_00096 [uncultured marine phage]